MSTQIRFARGQRSSLRWPATPQRGILVRLVCTALCVVTVLLVVEMSSGAATVSTSTSGPSAVAQATGAYVSLYTSPSSMKPYARLNNPISSGGPLVFLVSNYSRAPKWLRVYLPERPNESQAWIRGRAVTLSKDDYRIVANLNTHRILVYKDAKILFNDPVGVGRSVLPTPTGTYYLFELLKQPNPFGAYGPYAFGLSAFSNVLHSFGGGPGQIGLHGTDVPSSVGKSASHGCLRVTNTLITRLAKLLPLGTPVEIVR